LQGFERRGERRGGGGAARAAKAVAESRARATGRTNTWQQYWSWQKLLDRGGGGGGDRGWQLV